MTQPAKIPIASAGTAAGQFVDALGNPATSGYLMLQLNGNGGSLTGGGQVSSLPAVKVSLDVNGVPSAGQSIYISSQFASPVNPAFRVRLHNSNDLMVFDLGNCILAGNPIDLTTLVASSNGVSYSGAVLLNPGANQTISTGDLAITNNETIGGTLAVTGTSTLGAVNAGATTVTSLVATAVGGGSAAPVRAQAAANAFMSYGNTSAGADQKWWDSGVSGTVFSGRAVNDANNASASWVTVNRGAGATIGAIIFGAGGGTQTLPTATGTLARKSGDTFTSTTLTAPVINGTPTGTGIPTVTFKKGTNGGDYTTASTSFVQVDGTNLTATITIPTGWKLVINCAGTVTTTGGSATVTIMLADGGSQVQATTVSTVGAAAQSSWSMAWQIAGDGAAHTIDLRFKTSANTADILNSGGIVPTMVFTLTPSN